jgi:hypothetical protein
MLRQLGQFLITRFPEKKVVTPADYQALTERLSNLEANSVHKDAVKILVLKMKEMQDEFATVKTGLGLNSPKVAELQALLNGEPIGIQENFNG